MVKAMLRSLAFASFGGLALVALGVLPFGPRGVALLALFGLVWIYSLVWVLGRTLAHLLTKVGRADVNADATNRDDRADDSQVRQLIDTYREQS